MIEQKRKMDHTHSFENSSHSIEHLSVMHRELQHLHYNTHDHYNDNFASDEIDACIAKINAIEIENVDAPWYFDSGATHYISKNQKVFTSLEPTSGSTIESTSEENHMVFGVGNVVISLL